MKTLMNKNWHIKNTCLEEKERLFLFPYAGGGSRVFYDWDKLMNNTSLYTAIYPGRENRIREKMITDFSLLTEEFFYSMKNYISNDVPYYLFGHSLGTKIIYELVLRLKKEKSPLPRGIIVSAGAAPCIKAKYPIHKLNDENFIKEINGISGTPSEIICNHEIMKMFIPMLRTDFLLDELYNNDIKEKIAIPILGLMGTEDEELTLDELRQWKEYTSMSFIYKYIKGNHMFVKSNKDAVIKEIKEFIRNCKSENI